MSMAAHHSWGRFPRVQQETIGYRWRHEAPPIGNAAAHYLPYGNGRSYGDVCLNHGGAVIDMCGLDRFVAFDPATGVVRCEAGVLLAEILDFAVPQGWFLPVTPGTKFVTVGGAIANDVHGKNHHHAGTFGRHVLGFELVRSDGTRRWCSPAENADWFAATVGGLGLTGLVTVADVALKRIASPGMSVEIVRYPDLDAFFALTAESDRDYEYTVAWVDSMATGRGLGRGLFMRANHAAAMTLDRPRAPRRRLAVPVELPVAAINRATLKAFNWLYYRRGPARRRGVVHYDPYFYPLDAISDWNRLYGPRGMTQYQCVVPLADGPAAMRELLGRVAATRDASFLSILKKFGDVPSPGTLSFPRPGFTLTLDFPIRGKETLALLDRLDEVVGAAGGAVYPAKDARMSGQSFRRYFPQWRAFARYIDPRLSSSLWRRVTVDSDGAP